MKRLISCATILFCSAAAAQAADLPARMYTKAAPPMDAVYNWTGFYIGGNVGYGWNDRSTGLAASPDAASAAFFGPSIAAGALPTSYRLRPDGVIGGGQIGYNWQSDRFVFGLETDIQGSGVRGNTSVTTTGIPAFVPITTSFSDRLEYFGTVRGRLGIAMNTVLFYATGGFAYGEMRYAGSAVTTIAQAFSLGQSNFETGYAAGAGVEWAFAPNWSAKAEYLFLDFGNRSIVSTPGIGVPAGASTITTFRDQFNIARVGVNYKWGGPIVARY